MIGSRTRWLVLAGLLWMAPAAGLATAATLATVAQSNFIGIPRLAIGADGLPLILFAGLDHLELARCQDWACASVSIQALASIETTPHYALAIGPGGNPAIAWQGKIDHDLKVARCTTPDCSGALSPARTIDSGVNDIGSFVALAFGPDGRPAFAYLDGTDGIFKYARCALPNCNQVEVQALTDSGFGLRSGEFAAIAFGTRADPVVSAHWQNVGIDSAGVHWFDCAIAPCSAGMQMIFYQSGEWAGAGQDMALLADDTPVFSFLHEDLNAIHYGLCLNPQCTNRTAFAVDDGAQVEAFHEETAIVVRPGDRPAIAYRRDTATPDQVALLVIECGDAACAQRETVLIQQGTQADGTGSYPDTAVDHDGAVVLAYIDIDAQRIRLARCNAQTCEGPGDRLFGAGFD